MTIVRTETLIAVILLVLTWLGSRLAGIPMLDRISISVGSVATGLAGGLLLASFVPLAMAPWARRMVLLRDLNRVCETVLLPLTRDLRLIDVLALAVLSGVSEELFFRGVLQPLIGLTGASVLFGLLHWLSPAYAAWATGVGLLLGAAYTTTGNLVVPTTMHGTHNFVALLYLRFWHVERT